MEGIVAGVGRGEGIVGVLIGVWIGGGGTDTGTGADFVSRNSCVGFRTGDEGRRGGWTGGGCCCDKSAKYALGYPPIEVAAYDPPTGCPGTGGNDKDGCCGGEYDRGGGCGTTYGTDVSCWDDDDVVELGAFICVSAMSPHKRTAKETCGSVNPCRRYFLYNKDKSSV